jgi:hypothetical protein
VNRHEIDELWFSFRAVPGISFGLNDSVRIKSGMNSGEVGSVIALASLYPIPSYIVELGDGGGDIEVVESDIERAI